MLSIGGPLFQRKGKVDNHLGNFKEEGEALFLKGVQGELGGLVLGGLHGARLDKGPIQQESLRNKRDPYTHCV
jgi:hypothetical protein